ncbi:MAG: GNAT family N-acetyltransferase [Rubrobacter sp.]|nr:GNAT family N-acetyltransferase [Rubrobacter sp.]
MNADSRERSGFVFLEPGRLVEGDLELVLVGRSSGDPVQGRLPSYRFEMRLVGTGRHVGNVDLRVGDTHDLVMYSGQIGYSVLPGHRGNRYAARSCALLLPLAHEHGMSRLWITCNPDNLASRRTCEILGAELVETVDLPPDTPAYRKGERQKLRYKIEL